MIQISLLYPKKILILNPTIKIAENASIKNYYYFVKIMSNSSAEFCRLHQPIRTRRPLVTLSEAESVESVERRTIASEEVALMRHFKVAKMRTLDTRRQLTVLKLKSIISNL